MQGPSHEKDRKRKKGLSRGRAREYIDGMDSRSAA